MVSAFGGKPSWHAGAQAGLGWCPHGQWPGMESQSPGLVRREPTQGEWPGRRRQKLSQVRRVTLLEVA